MSRRSTGLTILELIVALTVISLLFGLLLPAVLHVRESARRLQCCSRLSQIGVALHLHHGTLHRLPAGWRVNAAQHSAFGWAVEALPYLEQSQLSQMVNADWSIADSRLAKARGVTLPEMLCPSDIAESSFELHREERAEQGLVLEGYQAVRLPAANYLGVFGTLEPDDHPAPLGDGAFRENRGTAFPEFQRGMSRTLLAGERTMAQAPSTWLGVDLRGEDAVARLVGAALQGINRREADECDFSSRHAKGANFLWADGHVGLLHEQIDVALYHQLARLRD